MVCRHVLYAHQIMLLIVTLWGYSRQITEILSVVVATQFNFELLSALAQKRSKDVVVKYRACDNIFCKYVLPAFVIITMSADLYFTSVSSSSSFFIFRPLISEVATRNSTKIGHMVGSKCNLKTHVRNLGYTPPLQIGRPKTTFFGRLRNLTANFTAYIFGMKHDIDNRSSALTYKGFPTSLQNVMNFGPQTASNSTAIFTHPP